MNCARCERTVGPGTATNYTFAYGTLAPTGSETAGPGAPSPEGTGAGPAGAGTGAGATATATATAGAADDPPAPPPFELAGWGQAFLCNPCLGDYALGQNKLRNTWLVVAAALVVAIALVFATGLLGGALLLVTVLWAAWTVGRLNDKAQIRWNPRGDDPDMDATRCGELLAIELQRPELAAQGHDAFLTRGDYAVLSRV
jgi:hypothetical protein